MSGGAIDMGECPMKPGLCKCGRCAVCGYHKHMSIHGPLFGRPPGSEPYGHEFAPVVATMLSADELKERS